MSTREMVLRVLDSLPDDATIEDVIERLYFLRKLQQRIAQIDIVEMFSDEEARRRLARWLR